MDTALDDWTALDDHASEDGYELTKQLAEFNTCTNQPEKYEVYDKDMLEVSPEKMSRNAASDENGRFDEILPVNLTIFMQIINRDAPDVLVNLTILAIFMQITSPGMSLTCWQI